MDFYQLRKTLVWKDVYTGRGSWNVTYYYPYSGILQVEFDTWQEAMDEAVKIEKWRQFI